MSHALINGQVVTRLHLTVGMTGPWFCDFDLDTEASDVSGAVTLTIGEPLTLVGTIDPARTGTYGSSKSGRIVAGANGWRTSMSPKDYANDAGVKARSVADDLARENGETFGAFVPTNERIGVHYVRSAGSSALTLEGVIGGASWWVDYEGRTQVGARPSNTPDEGAYEVLAYDPRSKRVELACDDLALITVGSVITKSLDGPLTVRDLEIRIDGEDRVIVAWCGPTATAGRLASLLQGIVRHTASESFWGKYRYRVFRMAGDRVDLQAIRKDAGLPDVMSVSMWPGLAGAHAELTPGAEVLVEFIEGDRAMPIITHFAGKDGNGHVPVSLALCGGVQAVARQGDLVQSGGPGATLMLTPLPGNTSPTVLPATPYLVSFSSDPTAVGVLAKPLYGAIATGSPKVRA